MVLDKSYLLDPENEPKTHPIMRVFLIMMFITLLISLFYALYLLYINIPGEAVKLDVFIKNIESEKLNLENSQISQFYDNMKFNHNKISYKIDNNCVDEKIFRMENAFIDISKKIPKISFIKINGEADIDIICNNNFREDIQENTFIAGEGGAKEIIPTGKFNIILKGIIYLYDENKKRVKKCDYPNVEVHELMHVFGFDHSENKNSLMYYYLDNCDQKLDDLIISELIRLYSLENLPDLYFENISVIKRGRYLDFNLTIKNSGSISAENVSLIIFDEDEIAERNNIGNVSFGSGIFIETKNFKLIRRNPKSISFVIDYDNFIKEFEEKNNFALINSTYK